VRRPCLEGGRGSTSISESPARRRPLRRSSPPHLRRRRSCSRQHPQPSRSCQGEGWRARGCRCRGWGGLPENLGAKGFFCCEGGDADASEGSRAQGDELTQCAGRGRGARVDGARREGEGRGGRGGERRPMRWLLQLRRPRGVYNRRVVKCLWQAGAPTPSQLAISNVSSDQPFLISSRHSGPNH